MVERGVLQISRLPYFIRTGFPFFIIAQGSSPNFTSNKLSELINFYSSIKSSENLRFYDDVGEKKLIRLNSPNDTSKIWRQSYHIKNLHEVFDFVGNKAKGRISKQRLQESKAREIFRKTNISYPLIRNVSVRIRG